MSLNLISSGQMRATNWRSVVMTGRAFIETRAGGGPEQEVTISRNDWRKVLAVLGMDVHSHVTMSTGLMVFDQIGLSRKMVDAERLRINAATYQDFMEHVVMPGLSSLGYFVDIRTIASIQRTFNLERMPGEEVIANSTRGTIRRHRRLIELGD